MDTSFLHTLVKRLGLALLLACTANAASAALSISQTPLFLTIVLPPNITVLLDDSGSMQWAYAPDSLGGSGSAKVYVNYQSSSCASGLTRVKISGVYYCQGYLSFSGVYIPDTYHFKSSKFNPLYYDPTVTYTAPYDASGNPLTTSFTAAYVNGYNTSAGSVDLSSAYEATVDYNPSSTASALSSQSGSDETNSCNNFSKSGSCNSRHNPGAAFYYTYNSANSGCTASTTDDSCYTLVTVSSSSGVSPHVDERQNFANWFSFYRTRNLTTVSSADIAFNGISQDYRVAWLNLHTCAAFDASSCKGWGSTTTYDNRIGTFTGTHRADFFNWLSRFPASGGTPLRVALETAGKYYQTSGIDSPYAFNPHVTDDPEYVCRPNYTVAMTDGLWNEATSNLTVSYGNADNTAITLPDGTQYPPSSPDTSHPYSNSNSNTLADVAFYYWANNLRPDLGTSTALQYMPFTKNITLKDSVGGLANVSPYWNAQNDPAQWPHMVTFTVGLGLSSSLSSPPSWGGNSYAGGYNDLVTGHVSWPNSFSCGDSSFGCTDPIGNVYDLWHAALDSRGEFFAADNPQAMAAAFNGIVTRIQGRVGSSSAIAVNSTRLDSNTLIYQAQFNSSDWSGEVLAYKINSDGSIGAAQWQASKQITSSMATTRNILTWDNTNKVGINFTWATLTASEQAALNKNIFGVTDTSGSDRLNYLRGDQSKEQSNAGPFRTRNVLLGDIVNSNPFYVGAQDFGFNTAAIAEGTSYQAFVTSKASRTPVLYVGSNDGMMHGFNANTGAEVFAYVPRGVYPNLSALTDPTYVHQYYVDGSPQSVDAYFGATPSWHTLLIGTTGAGAREIYLLDVTNPTSMTSSNVLYDYDGTVAGDNDMGYTIGQATVSRMHDGDWYMIWGNGYNSPNQHAVLYMYDISNPKLLKFDTKVGGSGVSNGMSTPAPIDYDGDKVADAIYVGDLQGNLWKLDVSSATTSQWNFAFKSGSTPLPFFTARDANNNVQPITDRPQVGLNSLGNVMVYFGTGTYFQTGDNSVGSNPPVQSFYGLIDDKADQVARSNLLQQSVITETSVNGTNLRITTNNTPSSGQQGWYIDLDYPSAQGERVVSDPVLDNGRIIFTTLIPQGNACQFGGISWLMELDGTTGGRLGVSPFDINGDGKVNNNDFVTVTYTDPNTDQPVTITVPVGGKQSNVGIIKTPGIISAGELEYKYYSGSTGNIGMTVESATSTNGRQSWQQLPNP